MSTTYQVYGIGAALVDTEIEVEDHFLHSSNIEKGLMTLVDEERQHELMRLLEGHLVASKRASGGSAANSIIAHSSFGGSAYYSCKVANDENGAYYLNDLKMAGVDSDFNGVREHGITGKCLVMISPDAERTMNTFLGISGTFCEKNLNYTALKNSQWLYIEGYLVTSDTGRNAAIKAREYAQDNGVKTALSFSDPGMVQFFKDGLKSMTGNKIDLIFCNEHEALGWADTEDMSTAIEHIKQVANTFAITLGSKGALVFDGQTLHNIAAHPVKAVDTNGAGDAFAGAFLYGITNGMTYAEAGKLASLTAAKVVSDFGPRLSKEGYQAALHECK
jgi:sugar/nucleoside kinase (ribokinase family)